MDEKSKHAAKAGVMRNNGKGYDNFQLAYNRSYQVKRPSTTQYDIDPPMRVY